MKTPSSQSHHHLFHFCATLWVFIIASAGVSLDVRAASAPTIVRASPVSPISVAVSVPVTFNAEATAGSGIKGIEWFVKTGTTSTPVQYTNLTKSFDYYELNPFRHTFRLAGTYYVFAYVYDRESPAREAFVYWEVNVSVPPPQPVTGVAASDGTYTDKVRVTWNSSSGATGYEVWRSKSNSSGSATKVSGVDLASTSFDDSSAVADTTYFYWVKAKNAGGTSAFSNSDSGWRKAAPPIPPTGVAASDGTYTDRVRVTWNSSSGATGYEVWRSTNNNSGAATKVSPTDITVTTFDDSSTVDEITYYYWVKAKNSGGVSVFSASDPGVRNAAAPTVVIVTPSTPVMLNSGQSQTFTARARAGSGIKGIQWFVKTNDTSVPKKYVDCTASWVYDKEDSFTNSFSADGTYYVFAYVYDRRALVRQADVSWRVVVTGLPPEPPTNVAASDGTYTDQVRVTWNSTSGATGYEVWRSTSNDSGSATRISGVDLASTSFDDSSAVADTTYFYWVKAKSAGGTSAFSNSDSGWRKAAPPIPPTGVAASDGTYTEKVRVTWNSSSGATSYEVWRSTSNNLGSATKVSGADPTEASFDDLSAVRGAGYFYWVRAKNAIGTSMFSSSDSGFAQEPVPVLELSAPVTKGSETFPCSITRHGAQSPIDANASTWLVIHGWNCSKSTDFIVRLANAILGNAPGAQILMLNWAEAAYEPLSLSHPFVASNEDWIQPMATAAAGLLKDAGFTKSNLNIVGHSWGANMAAEIAERLPEGVNAIIALDPAHDGMGDYNPHSNYNTPQAEVDFSRNAAFSWAFQSSWFGSVQTATSAHETVDIFTGYNDSNSVFPIENVAQAHNSAVPAFCYILEHMDDVQWHSYFKLQRLTTHERGPWRQDFYKSSFNFPGVFGIIADPQPQRVEAQIRCDPQEVPKSIAFEPLQIPVLAVSPTEGLQSSGPAGGLFSPSAFSYTILNAGGGNLDWTASADQNWVTVSPTGGQNNATVTVSINANANTLAAGTHSASVTFGGNGGSITRQVQLTIGPIPVTAIHAAIQGYSSPGTCGINVEISYPVDRALWSLLCRPTLPTGWTLTAVTGDGNPEIQGGEIVFLGGSLPRPVKFTYTCSVPVGMQGQQAVRNQIEYQLQGTSQSALVPAQPDPLLVDPQPINHSIDCNRDFVISGSELNRILAFWRAGGYHCDSSQCDGAAPGPGTAVGCKSSADFDSSIGVISGSEVNRVLAYWRAGGYHRDPAGPDGFSPGKSTGAKLSEGDRIGKPNVTGISFRQSSAPIYCQGGLVEVNCVLQYTGNAVGLLCRPLLPAGWQLEGVSGQGNPEEHAGDILWTGLLPPSPVTFSYFVRVPANESGLRKSGAEAEIHLLGDANPKQSVANSIEVADVMLDCFQFLPSGELRFRMRAGPSSRYEIQYSSDLASWCSLGYFTGTGEGVEVKDVSPDTRCRFYRCIRH